MPVRFSVWNRKLNLAALVVTTSLVTTNGRAAQFDKPATPVLTVYVIAAPAVPLTLLGPAKETVRKVFARIGVQVQYPRALPRGEQVSLEGAMVVHLSMDCEHPTEDGPAAVAQPYEGSAIRICYQRVRWTEGNMFLGPRLIGYIMVHEITHNLQGIARHSATGIMKASWTTRDYRDITDLRLPFEADDILLIEAGWKWRSSRLHVTPAAHTR